MSASGLEHDIGLLCFVAPLFQQTVPRSKGPARQQGGGECAGGLYITHLPPNRHKRLHPKAVGDKGKSTFITFCMVYAKFP
ncbi:hypothetical protein CHU95_08705 [Niveispirillum lacus]|uniref:Uncharacterized protein n=1 Tax=Niveispirillum lacus TaxID=1981099 RepID=A0A255Z1E1_9PROT|nr:hypothetical protein CHU95_08705 [Niveispirillum lacus]